MRSVYSVRLLTVHLAAGVSSATVPAGVAWVLRDLDAVYVGTTSSAFLILSGAAGQRIWEATWTTGASPVFEWRGRQVLEPGETVQLDASDSDWDATLSGYALTLP